MNTELQELVEKLREAKKERGRLSQIAADSGISYRTIYGLLIAEDPVASARTSDKLAAYFKKADRKARAHA